MPCSQAAPRLTVYSTDSPRSRGWLLQLHDELLEATHPSILFSPSPWDKTEGQVTLPVLKDVLLD